MGLGPNFSLCAAWLAHARACRRGCGRPGRRWCPAGISLWQAVHRHMAPDEHMGVHPPGYAACPRCGPPRESRVPS